MKKIFVLAFVSLAVFSGCKFWPFGGKILPESALPKGSHFVMVVDHSDGEQVKNMKKLIEMLPDYGIGAQFKEQVLNEESLKKDGSDLDYEKDILPILEGDFKLSVAVDLSKVSDGGSGGVFAALYTDEVSKMKKLLTEEQKTSKDLLYGNDGNIFVFGATQAEIDEGMVRLKNGTGFSENEDFKNASKNSKGNLGYVYLKKGDAVKKFLDNVGYKANVDVMNSMYAEVVAKEDGFGFEGFGNLVADKDIVAKNLPYSGKKLSLFDKVPLENPILYWEMPNVGQYIGNFVAGFKMGLEEVGGDTNLDSQKSYDDLVAFVSGFAGISKDEVVGVLESPFALALGDSGEKYPTISFYFDVDEKYAGAAKKMTASFDAYVDAIIGEFDGMVGVKGALKKDVNVVKGGGLNKLYVDFSAIPAEMLASFNFIPGLDIKKMKVELYYGLTGDNVFVISLYPDFNKVYGENVLGKNKDVVDVLDKIGNNPFDAIFFSPEKLMNFVERNYYEAAKSYGILTGDYEKYYGFLKDTMQTLKYFVFSLSMPENDKVLFNSFLKFQERKGNEAMEKVKDGK
ncbi:hypothetical protein COY05_02805 [Candidatus Peregrinibacteria bacterium CG_4_10_14_0_2_um_filter_38_24]|nr:MAG: hypothetical protein COY05_02805 [Candidatus Peregrinibacteria bacterium CG_4_10_14_0_2_um_filter_38_24]PJC39185.1 MAG: hypothetical protein CO044_01115 [Candidatus Peregrinibacteria bacterium CG_4_9_14_0_2_um_filter_38_9]